MEKPHVHPLFRPPPPTTEPMEFLCRSWSISAREISKTIAPRESCVDTIHEPISLETEETAARSINQFSFASSETSMLVLERIMTQSDVSPRTSGRLSHSSGPLNGGLSCGSLSDSPPVSPSEIDNTKHHRPASIPMNYSVATASNGGGNKNVGRWFKDRKERKKEELRAHNAQIHAAVSVAGVASAIAAIAAATAASSSKDEQAAKTDAALASAATLVATQCVEAAEAMGAEREHLACVVSSAVNCSSASDIMTLTAAAATALRAATTLKARTLKDVWTVNPTGGNTPEQNFLAVCNRELLSRGCELLKRTRKGDLHWKIVSLYINKLGQVMLKMKSRHVVGTVTKKKKNVVLELVKDIPAWPGRHLLEGGDQRRYFGLRTVSRGLVEFECKNQREYHAWTQGISRLLEIAEQRNNKHRF